jgi:hypothetical protein
VGQPLVPKQLFDTVKADGLRSARIPVTCSGHAHQRPNLTDHDNVLARFQAD